jgi:formylglycine-generating enzyme required for sulfatase activity
MHGNVVEWCQDWFGTYPGGIAVDPQGPAAGSKRTVRGGGWSYDARDCRSASRININPDYRFPDIGFRVVLAPGQP